MHKLVVPGTHTVKHAWAVAHGRWQNDLQLHATLGIAMATSGKLYSKRGASMVDT